MSYFHQYGAEKDALVSHDSLSGSFHVVLPSGRSVILTLSMNSTVSEIRDAAKDALQVNFLRLMCLDWTCDHVILMQMESKCNYASWYYIYIITIHVAVYVYYTVDGKNLAPVDRKFIPLFTGLFHPRWCRISSINSISDPFPCNVQIYSNV